jgi:hypothetical protein
MVELANGLQNDCAMSKGEEACARNDTMERPQSTSSRRLKCCFICQSQS